MAIYMFEFLALIVLWSWCYINVLHVLEISINEDLLSSDRKSGATSKTLEQHWRSMMVGHDTAGLSRRRYIRHHLHFSSDRMKSKAIKVRKNTLGLQSENRKWVDAIKLASRVDEPLHRRMFTLKNTRWILRDVNNMGYWSNVGTMLGQCYWRWYSSYTMLTVSQEHVKLN